MGADWKQAASAAMDRYASGDDAAFGALYDALAPRLSSFFLRRTSDRSRVEDLLQQTFLQMHSARRHFAVGGDVTPWAFAIARHLVTDLMRKSGREVILGDDDDDASRESIAPGAPPDQQAAERRLGRRVERELQRMAGPQRIAFELVHCDGLVSTPDLKSRILAQAQATPSRTREQSRLDAWLVALSSSIVVAALYFALDGPQHGRGRPLWFYVARAAAWFAVAALSLWGPWDAGARRWAARRRP